MKIGSFAVQSILSILLTTFAVVDARVALGQANNESHYSHPGTPPYFRPGYLTCYSTVDYVGECYIVYNTICEDFTGREVSVSTTSVTRCSNPECRETSVREGACAGGRQKDCIDLRDGPWPPSPDLPMCPSTH